MAVIPSTSATNLRLSLGPIQYHWSKEKMLDFYHMIESMPVDIVYLGEAVCSKRRSFRHEDWIEIAERLQAAGKEVVLSTLALVEAHSELGYIRKLCNNGKFKVEANDMSAVQMLAGKTPFVGGASLNIYNPRSLKKLADLGLTRWVMPVELSQSVLAAFQDELPVGIETEVYGWGRLPIAYSARCYTARAHEISKDNCLNCCIDYPDGLMLSTREDERFLIINGIQTQSARDHALVDGLSEPSAPMNIVRLNPQSQDSDRVISIFDELRSGVISPGEATQSLGQYSSVGLCNGYWHGGAGMDFCEAEVRS